MGYLHINTASVFEGLAIILFLKRPKWTWKILGTASGQLAKIIIEAIKRSEQEYPHLQSYKLTGPNSNTYTQWVIEKFSKWNVVLPRNAFGKK